jgi:8-oxo-dGTP diphosphatase
MIYKNKPQEFNSKSEVVGCFMQYEKEILLLHRQDYKPEGNTWGMPAGKVDSGENVLETMIREIQEEIGIVLPASKLNYFKKIYVKYPSHDFIYHIFHNTFETRPEIKLNPKEHKDFRWISPEKALALPLVTDGDACIKLFFRL